jgi:hypothetical protein
MTNRSLATIADYADALGTARRARSVLTLIISVILVFQIGLFFAARYKIQLEVETVPVDALKYAVGLTNFAGVVLPIVLAFVLFLIVEVMLIARLLGIARLVWGFIACLVLITLLFPWQAFLMNQTFASPEFKIPGVLYTWEELVLRARLHPVGFMRELLFWARFVFWPALALALLWMIQFQTGQGLRTAFGETVAAAPAPVSPSPALKL